MILLTTTNDSMTVTTSTSESLHYTVNYVDITSSSFTPGSSQGTISSATSTTVISSPGSGIKRQVKYLSFFNADDGNNVVTVNKKVSSTEYKINSFELEPGQTLEYVDSSGFAIFPQVISGGGGGGAVDSVNGQTGVVVLDQDDVADGSTYKQYSATEKSKLAGIESGAEVNDVNSVNSKTGTVVLNQDDVGDGSTYKQYSSTEKSKLSGIEALADVTDSANVIPAISAASISTATVAGSDKVLIKDTSDSDNTKTVTAQEIRDLSPTSGTTGTGNEVRQTSPTLITPNLGVAGATSINFGQDPLDYYDEGTFTPTFTFATVGNLSVSYAAQTGFYTRVGNMVFVITTLVFTPTFTTSSGEAQLRGLPFTSGNANHALLASSKSANVTFPSGTTQFFGYTANSSYIVPRAYGTSTAQINLNNSNFTSGQSHSIVITGTYLIGI